MTWRAIRAPLTKLERFTAHPTGFLQCLFTYGGLQENQKAGYLALIREVGEEDKK